MMSIQYNSNNGIFKHALDLAGWEPSPKIVSVEARARFHGKTKTLGGSHYTLGHQSLKKDCNKNPAYIYFLIWLFAIH